MSVMDELKNVVTTGRELLATVSGKVKEIDKKVDQATQAVPVAIKEFSEQSFYIDAVNGSDNNQGTERSPFQSIRKVNDVAVNGGAIRIYIRRNQVHVIESGGVSIQTGSISVTGYGSGEKPKLIQRTKYSPLNDAHYGAGFGVRNGSIMFSGVNIETNFNPNNAEEKVMEWRSGLIVDSQGSTSVHFNDCGLKLSEMPIMSVFSGLTGRDIYISGCEIEVINNEKGNARLVRSRTGSSYSCLKVDVYNTSLVGDLNWPDLFSYYSDKRNIITNLSLT